MSTAGSPAWDRLPSSALVRIFRRLPLKDRFLGGPFVCRPWADAARNPQCWESMLPDGESPELHFIKNADELCSFLFPHTFSRKEVRAFIHRSQGCATTVYLPKPTDTHERNRHVNLSYIAERCPKLKHLYLQPALIQPVQTAAFRKLMYSCKDVELIALVCDFIMTPDIMDEMRRCWPKLRGFINYFDFDPVGVTAIVTKFPKLQFLGLKHTTHSVESLEAIVNGCPDLKFLKVVGRRNALLLLEEGLQSMTSVKISEFLESDPSNSNDSGVVFRFESLEDLIYYDLVVRDPSAFGGWNDLSAFG